MSKTGKFLEISWEGFLKSQEVTVFFFQYSSTRWARITYPLRRQRPDIKAENGLGACPTSRRAQIRTAVWLQHRLLLCSRFYGSIIFAEGIRRTKPRLPAQQVCGGWRAVLFDVCWWLGRLGLSVAHGCSLRPPACSVRAVSPSGLHEACGLVREVMATGGRCQRAVRGGPSSKVPSAKYVWPALRGRIVSTVDKAAAWGLEP